MKFSDIEPFIISGDYEVNVSLEHLERTLDNFSLDYGLDLNPDFQRGNVWTEEQQVSYMEFFLRGGTTSRVIYFNSPAFGGSKSNKGDLDETILCVDGLQRLTSSLRFVRNEIKVFGFYYREYEDRPRLRQGFKFNINSLCKRADVLRWYIEFNSGGTVHSKEEIDRVRLLLEKEK